MNVNLKPEIKERIKKMLIYLAELKHNETNGANFCDFNFTDILEELEQENLLKKRLTAKGDKYFFNKI